MSDDALIDGIESIAENRKLNAFLDLLDARITMAVHKAMEDHDSNKMSSLHDILQCTVPAANKKLRVDHNLRRLGIMNGNRLLFRRWEVLAYMNAKPPAKRGFALPHLRRTGTKTVDACYEGNSTNVFDLDEFKAPSPNEDELADLIDAQRRDKVTTRYSVA